MPKHKIKDIEIYYEAYGSGETVLYLQSCLGGLNHGAYYFAGRMSRSNRVIIWDSPNTGQSGVMIKDTQSEYHMVCEYLMGLLDVLGEDTVHLVGCSGGGELGLLFTHLYPAVVKSLAMYRPTTMTSSAEKELVVSRFFDIADYAEGHSMEQVIEFSKNPPEKSYSHFSKWIAELYKKDKDRILSFNNNKFAQIMRKWGKYMGSQLFYRANLTDKQLSEIDVPVLIAPSADEHHTEEIAVDLHKQLLNSTLIPSKRFRKENEIYNASFDEHPFGGFVEFVNDYEKFAGMI